MNIESLAEIEQAASRHILATLQKEVAPPGSKIDINVKPLDPHLSLPACGEQLLFELPNLGRNNLQRLALKVSCEDINSWSIYIRATANVWHPIVLASSALPRNSVISAEHLTMKIMDISKLFRGYYLEPTPLIGSITRYPIKSGQVITPRQINPKLAVRSGDRVTIRSNASGFSIAVNGLALAGGQIGEQIKVRNVMSNREILAKIESEGIVVVGR